MSKTADLDAFLNEKRGEVPVVRLFGEEWVLRPTFPPLLYLDLLDAAGRETSPREDYEKSIEIVRAVIASPDRAEEFLAHDPDFETLGLFVQVALGLYNGVSAEETLANAGGSGETGDTPGPKE